MKRPNSLLKQHYRLIQHCLVRKSLFEMIENLIGDIWSKCMLVPLYKYQRNYKEKVSLVILPKYLCIYRIHCWNFMVYLLHWRSLIDFLVKLLFFNNPLISKNPATSLSNLTIKFGFKPTWIQRCPPPHLVAE